VVTLYTERVTPELTRQQVQAALERGREMVQAAIQLVSTDGKLVMSMSRDELVRNLRSKAYSAPPRLDVYFDHDAIEAVIQSDRERLEREPKDASFRIGQDGGVHIVPGRPGTRLDKAMVAQALLQAVYAPGHVGQLPVERDALLEFTTEDARALNITKLVGKFSTRHKCCQARVQNIHRIADILDGTVVKPGETFSINEKVGPRTAASGFVPAPTIVEGDMEDTVGGGVSQFATTYFNALLHAGYDIVERQPHSYWFTRYPMGHEATLSYPKPDVIFRNDTKSGVLIKTEYTDTRITVKLYGDNEGRKVQTSISQRQDIVDPPVELVPDPSVPSDEEKLLEGGMVGWSVIAGRAIKFKDKPEKVEKRKVTYMPRVRRIRVHPCRIPEGEEGYTGKDCPEPEDAEMTDHTEADGEQEPVLPTGEPKQETTRENSSQAPPDL
jgi:vancomycin resistance protein YoaR